MPDYAQPATVPGYGTTDTIRHGWLNLCAPCDAGMPAACTCPRADPRSVIRALCDALDQTAPIQEGPHR